MIERASVVIDRESAEFRPLSPSNTDAEAFAGSYDELMEQINDSVDDEDSDDNNEQDSENTYLTDEEQRLLNDALEEAHREPETQVNNESDNIESNVESNIESNVLIKENSKTHLIDETTSRFSSALWYNEVKNQNIILAGVGGIGSYTGFLLGRLKPARLSIYDDDIVDSTNMSGQLYGRNDVGEYKTRALSRLLLNYSGVGTVFSHETKFLAGTDAAPIMICGFDNMRARKDFYNTWVRKVEYLRYIKEDDSYKKYLFIDGRLAAEEFQIFCIKGDDDYNMKRYEKEFLFSDEEADATICSYKQTSFCANMIASCIVNLFVNFIANQCEPLIERDVPFLTTYNGETMYFKTEN